MPRPTTDARENGDVLLAVRAAIRNRLADKSGPRPELPERMPILGVDGFEQDLIKTYHVEIVPDIPTLCSKVDGLLLESGDGRVHLAQARQVIAAGKPLFIDPPLASTLEEAREIGRLAKEAGVPWFSSSTVAMSTQEVSRKPSKLHTRTAAE